MYKKIPRLKRNDWVMMGTLFIFLIVGLVFRFFFNGGIFKTAKTFLKEGYTVEVIKTPPGIEDLDYDPDNQTVFLSSCDRRTPGGTGDIYALNPQTGNIVNLTDHLDIGEFRPHGISFIHTDSGKFLFVISHKNEKNVVLRFQFENDSLSLLNSYSSFDFSSPNDILAVGDEAFFVTNDHGKAKGLKKNLIDFLQLPMGNVVYFADNKTTVVLEKIAYPNGMVFKDGLLYIASTLGNYIKVYKAVTNRNHLESIHKFRLPNAPDNLMLLDNKIFIASHPKLISFLQHAQNPKKKSASEISYLDGDKIVTVFSDDGSLLSGSSTALPFYDSDGGINILVGSVFEEKILLLNKKP